jgi:hypothetical protein
MIVKNWMSKNPDVISSDLLAKEAMELFEECLSCLLWIMAGSEDLLQEGI